MQGIWSYLLHRYTGSDDVVYGVIVSGRPEDLPGVEQRVGLYINTLPLYTKIKKDKSISKLAAGTSERTDLIPSASVHTATGNSEMVGSQR